MKSEPFRNLDEEFNTEKTEIDLSSPVEVLPAIKEVEEISHKLDDSEYLRNNSKEAIDTMISLLNSAAEEAVANPLPEMFDSVSKLSTSVAKVLKELRELSTTEKDNEYKTYIPEEPKQEEIVNNNLILTTADLFDRIAKKIIEKKDK